MATNGPPARPERSWITRARTSLPTPLSPVRRTVESTRATRHARSKARRMPGLRAMTPGCSSSTFSRVSSLRRAFSFASVERRASRTRASSPSRQRSERPASERLVASSHASSGSPAIRQTASPFPTHVSSTTRIERPCAAVR